MNDEEINNLLELFKEGSIPNVSLAVSIMRHLEVDALRKIFIGIHKLLNDVDWVKERDGSTPYTFEIRESLQVLPDTYDIRNVIIYVRNVVDGGMYMDSVCMRIDSTVHIADDEDIMNMAYKLFKDYGYNNTD